jgi:hypothetical protein
MTLDRDQRVSRGRRAAEFLASDTVQEITTDVEADITEAWKRTAALDVDGRETLFRTLLGLHGLKGKLQAWVDDGIMAQSEIDQKNRERQTADINRG